MSQISTQKGITDNLKRKHALYHLPHKEQYLCEYLRSLATAYSEGETVNILQPCKKFGLIKETNGYCVYAFQGRDEIRYFKLSRQQISEHKGVDLKYVDAAPRPSQLLHLPGVVGVTDQRLREVVTFIQNNFYYNKSSALVALGAIAMCLHYPTLKKIREGVPVPVLYGPPGTSKSSVASLAFSCIGISNKTQDSTYGGILKKVTSVDQTPVWWEDVDAFNTFEKISMLIYNQGRRDTAILKDAVPPTCLPLATSNGFWDESKSMTRLIRTLGRTILIPFECGNRKEVAKNYSTIIKFDKDLLEMRKNAIDSFGWFLNMKDFFKNLVEDEAQTYISQILSEIEMKKLDERSLKNYGLVMFSTAKILEACEFAEDDIIELLKDYMKAVQMNYSSIISNEEDVGNSSDIKTAPAILAAIDENVENEKVVYLGKGNCSCKDVLYIDLKALGWNPKQIKAAKQWVMENNRGCVSRNFKIRNKDQGQKSFGFHVNTNLLPDNIKKKLSEGNCDLEVEEINETAKIKGDLEVEEINEEEGGNSKKNGSGKLKRHRLLKQLQDDLSKNEQVKGKRSRR